VSEREREREGGGGGRGGRDRPETLADCQNECRAML
jgi:hypothetical protein